MSAPYRRWTVDYDPKPIPTPQFDWIACHPDYDGEGDDRIVFAATEDGLHAEIDAWHDEQDGAEPVLKVAA